MSQGKIWIIAVSDNAIFVEKCPALALCLSVLLFLKWALPAGCKPPMATLWDAFFCHFMTYMDDLNGKKISLSPQPYRPCTKGWDF